VTTPGVFVEFIEVLDEFGSQWVEMNVANQLKEIGIFFAHDGFVAVLEEMPASIVPFIEGDGVSCHETTHDFA